MKYFQWRINSFLALKLHVFEKMCLNPIFGPTFQEMIFHYTPS